ncbi:MAG: PKD domain-containing protein [Thermoplasmata archaeon]|nr:PKD domain-containing protein [Thermoplasmata archaeon]
MTHQSDHQRRVRRTSTIFGLSVLGLLLLVSSSSFGGWGPADRPALRALGPPAVGVQPWATGLLLSPTNGTVGSSLAATGTGFAVNSTISFHFAGTAVRSTCSTDTSGSFPGTSGTACTFAVPPSPRGPERVSASDGTLSANASFSVNSTVTLSPPNGTVGSLVAANGTGFSAGIPIGFSLAGRGVPSVCSSDVNGSFPGTSGTACTFIVPEAPGGHETVVTSEGGRTGNVTAVNVGSNPVGVAYDSGRGEVFVANYNSNNVSVFTDTNGTVVASIGVGSNPVALAYDAARGEVFVTNTNSNNVSVIADVNNTVVASIPVGTAPFGIAYDAGLGELFVANVNSYNVSVISDTNNTVVASVPTGSATDPRFVAYDSGRNEVFVSQETTNNVTVITDSNNSIVTTVHVGTNPFGLAYDAGRGEIFVATIGSNNVSVISDANNTVVAAIGVGTSPLDAAYDPGLGEIFVTNSGTNNVSVITDSNNTVVATAAVGSYPYTDAYDSGIGAVAVANFVSGNVSLIPTGTGHSELAQFAVRSTLSVAPASRSVDVGKTVTLRAAGFGSSLPITNFTLGAYPLACTSATTGGCVAGVLTTDAWGSLVGNFSVPPVSASGPFTLTVGDSIGNNRSVILTVYTDPSVAGVTASVASADIGQSVTFMVVASFGSGGYTYVWSGLPSGCSGTSATISCTPAAAGTSLVAASVTDSNGATVPGSDLTFVVYPDPVVGLPLGSVVSGVVDAGQSVTFTASASLGTQTYTSFTWSGLPAGCGGTLASITCAGVNLPAGSYSISVTVTDSNNFQSAPSANLSFVVFLDPTVTALSPSPSSVDVGQSVTFTATTASGAAPYSYLWSGLPTGCSGAATAALGCTPSGPGGFSVQLQVTDTNNFTVSSGALAFTVYANPTANLSASALAFDAGQAVTLTATGSLGSGGFTYAWTGLPTGCSGSTSTVSCTPSGPGKSQVRVTVKDSNGRSAQSPAVVLVVAPPISGNISATSLSPSPGQSVGFTATFTGGTGVRNYHWGFGDGSSGGGSTVNHTYASAGRYTVSLWANDSSGGSVVKTLAVSVSSSASTSGAASPQLAYAIVAVIVVAAVTVATLLVLRRRRTRANPPEDVARSSPTGEEPAPASAGEPDE